MKNIKRKIEKLEKIKKGFERDDRHRTFIIPEIYSVPFNKLESCPEYLNSDKSKDIYLPCDKCKKSCNSPDKEIPEGHGKLYLMHWIINYVGDVRQIIVLPEKGAGWPDPEEVKRGSTGEKYS